MYHSQSIIATLYNPYAGRGRCGTNDPAAFSIAFAAGVTADGPYGKVSGLNVSPEPQHELGQTWGKLL